MLKKSCTLLVLPLLILIAACSPITAAETSSENSVQILYLLDNQSITQTWGSYDCVLANSRVLLNTTSMETYGIFVGISNSGILNGSSLVVCKLVDVHGKHWPTTVPLLLSFLHFSIELLKCKLLLGENREISSFNGAELPRALCRGFSIQM